MGPGSTGLVGVDNGQMFADILDINMSQARVWSLYLPPSVPYG